MIDHQNWRQQEGHFDSLLLLQGLGTERYSTGQTYAGHFLNGRAHGKGRSQDPDGTVYEGNWKNGKRDGLGKVTYPNGDYQIGMWDNDNNVGTHKLYHKDDTLLDSRYYGGAEIQGVKLEMKMEI